MKKPLHPVSDHAVLRYLERVRGVDVEAVRREIGQIVDLSRDHGGACGVISGGFVFKLQGGVVTTVIIHNRPDLRTGRQRRERSGE